MRGNGGRVRRGAVAVSTALAVTGAMTPGPASAQEEVLAQTPHFRLHSDPWMNLHHFLYQWSRGEEGIGTGRQAVAVPEREEEDALSPEQARGWRGAVDLYREALAERGHFDDLMLEIKTALWARSPGEPLPRARLEALLPGLGEALASAFPVYRARWWPAHDRANRAWLAGVLPLLERHEEFGVATLERAYHGRLQERLRVDVTAYANWAGGYTSNGPAHVVVLSTDPMNEGVYGLELLMHEPGHASPLGRPLREGLAAAFQGAGAEVPSNLSHAILFFTAGWIAGEVAREEGRGPHTPYAVAEGLVGFRGWEGLWPALEADWRPFLDREISREEALSRLAVRFRE